MGWGRIDDGFDDHPKVVAILDEDDTPSAAAAIALWTLCFTWAHRNTRKRGKTPGLLPAGLPRRFLGHLGKDGAQILVKHGLWEPQDDGGWMIHDFGDYLPNEETRAARSEAGKRGAEKRWADKHAAEAAATEAEMANCHGEDGNLPSDSHGDASKPEANDGSRAPARRDPTPIPEPEETLFAAQPAPPSSTAPARSRGTRLPDNFEVTPEMVAWARKHAPGVDIGRELIKFRNYWTDKTGKDATKVKWVATWQNWMINAWERLPGNRATGAAPPSNAPDRVAPDEQCPEHRGQRRDSCRLCRAARLGRAG